tara:strand:- start:99050 stop:100384 length:1335 start_codon:yes stop_codon:yes gene_type:complete
MKAIFRKIYLEERFFTVLALLILGFLIAYTFEDLYGAVKLLFFLFLLVFLVDFTLLFASKGGITAIREVPNKLSNGDENVLHINISNGYFFSVGIKIVDEIPFQFQKRDFLIGSSLAKGRSAHFTYSLRPTQRGIHSFGNLNVFVSSPIGFIAKKYTFDNAVEVAVYPSFLQLRKYDLLAFSNRLSQYGLKKIRKIGQTMEFEQIKEYVQGDNIRNLNWKATAKRGHLMVNQYQDEKAQPIYSVIDKGRVMKMPFNGLSLLDRAINATLVISNIALKKNDKAGMFSFCRRMENRVMAEKRSSQMNRIMENLYNLQTDFAESDFGRLYTDIKRTLHQRGLLLLYTNFETLDALKRQLPYLQAISKHHLLVVIFFENTELTEFADRKANTVQQIYEQTIAEKFIYEKKLIVNELRRFGIQTLLTKPENLTVDTINKYLEIKARGLL